MIYRLPTHGRLGYGKRAYRGKYPNRISSFGVAKGVYHVETNSGARYVLTGHDMTREALNANSFYGRDFISITRYAAINPEPMSLGDYAAIVFINRLARLCNQTLKGEAFSQFERYYPGKDWGTYLAEQRIIPSLNGSN